MIDKLLGNIEDYNQEFYYLIKELLINGIKFKKDNDFNEKRFFATITKDTNLSLRNSHLKFQHEILFSDETIIKEECSEFLTIKIKSSELRKKYEDLQEIKSTELYLKQIRHTLTEHLTDLIIHENLEAGSSFHLREIFFLKRIGVIESIEEYFELKPKKVTKGLLIKSLKKEVEDYRRMLNYSQSWFKQFNSVPAYDVFYTHTNLSLSFFLEKNKLDEEKYRRFNQKNMDFWARAKTEPIPVSEVYNLLLKEMHNL